MFYFRCFFCGSFMPSLESAEEHVERKHPYKAGSLTAKKKRAERTGKHVIRKVAFADCFIPVRKHHVRPNLRTIEEVKFKKGVVPIKLISEDGFVKHATNQRTENGKLRFSCDICPQKLATKQGLTRHKLIHLNLGDRSYTLKCDVCGKPFSCPRNLRVHVETHNPNRARPFPCELCQKTFMSLKDLKTHIKTHADVKPFSCEICKKFFKKKETFKNHMSTKHSKTPKKEFNCLLCPKKYFKKYSLKMHMKTHSGPRPFICDLCSNAFYSKGGLKRHKIMVHEKLRPFQCEICGGQFTQKSNLKEHVKTCKGHPRKKRIEKFKLTEEGNFQCNTCKKEFKGWRAVQRHLQIHEDDRKRGVSCDICKKSFFERTALNSHMKIHNGHKCLQCGTIYRSRMEKEEHQSNVHGKPLNSRLLNRKRGKSIADLESEVQTPSISLDSIKQEPLQERSGVNDFEMVVTDIKYEFPASFT